MKVVTNNRRRLLINFDQLTKKEQEYFSYCKGEGSFFRYRGNVYDMGEFMRNTDKNLPNWDGSAADTYFSATLVRICKDDSDYIVAGRCYSV